MEEFAQIKSTLDKKQRERDQLLGKKSSILEPLRLQGFNTIKDAEAALKKIDGEIEKMEDNLQDNISEFKEKYKDLL